MSLTQLALRHTPLLLATCLAGCQIQPPLAPSAWIADHSVTLALLQPNHLLTTLGRRVVTQLDHYTAALWKFDGIGYVITSSTVDIKPLAGAGLTFNHLGSAKYQVHVTGRDTTNTVITSDAVASIDLTGNDVAVSQTLLVLAPLMLDTPFAGTIHLPAVPAWATHMDGTLKDANSVLVQSISYAPSATSHVDLQNISASAGNYTLALTASNKTYSELQTQSVSFDIGATTLSTEASPVFAWVGP